MADIRLERKLPVPVDRLWQLLTETRELLRWWGPEGITVPEDEHALDFTRAGPWYSVMVNAEGQRFKVSGEVTHLDPPRELRLTWGWHDDDDARGHESVVTLTVTPAEGGARLVLEHRDLADDEAAERHTEGWASSLDRLERRAI